MKKIIILVGAIVIVLIGALAVFYFYLGEGELNINESNTNTADENVNAPAGEDLNVNALPVDEEGAEAISRQEDKDKIEELARTFAERYGSYSNKSDFENLVSLFSWMTPGFQATTENFIKAEKAKLTGEEDYFAITSKIVSIQVPAINEAGTAATVFVERIERNETAKTASYLQKLALQFKKISGLWKVDSAVWQEKSSL